MHTGATRFPPGARPGSGGKEWQRAGGASGPKPGRAPLTKQARLLLTVHGLFAAANALSGTFVNVYLWKARHDFSLIGWFTFVHHLTMALTFWVAGKWVKEHNKMNCLRAGVAVSAVFYSLVLWFGERAADHFIVLGVVQGLSAGLFWLAFNVVYFEVTSPDDRDRFNGWTGLLGSGAGMLAPWISGMIIVRMEATAGYRFIFSLSAIVFVLGVIVSFFLKKRKSEGAYDWWLAVSCLKQKDTAWRKVVPALMAQGVREGVFGFMIALLVYVQTGNESKLGSFSLITSAVSLLSFMITGRLLKPRHRKAAMLIGACALVLMIVPFFWQVSFITLLVFGVGVGIFFPMYTIPMISTVFDLIGGDAESAKRREEYIVLREHALNAGRLLGTGIFILAVSMTTSPAALNWLLLGIGASPLVAWFFMRHIYAA